MSRALSLLVGLLMLFANTSKAQEQLPYNWMPRKQVYVHGDSAFLLADTTKNKHRNRLVSCTTIGGYGIAYAALSYSWYRDFPRTRFHFFDDNHEWAQVDKAGHFLGGYQGARGMIALYKWAGMPRWKSALYGSLIGFGAMAPLEILDGFADKWGASWGDLVADFGGAALAFGNEMAWGEQRIQCKVSYHPTRFAVIRPDLFGDKYTKYLKDYNGHTAWLTCRVHSFLPEGKFKDKFPRWLGVAAGYGANGLLGGYDNGITPAIREREFRQYYLALDYDLGAIKTRYGGLHVLLEVLNVIKLPSPTLEYNSKSGLLWHWFYM